jgi:hypothetical protein
MIGFNLFKASPAILEKIKFLYLLLRQGKKEYEKVAINISDKELRRTVLTLAQENNQYSCELSSQIESLGGLAPKENLSESEHEGTINILNNDNEVLAFCKMNEKKMVNAYREILNEPFLYEGLREIVHYQLNGTLCAFMQLKLLNSLKFHSASMMHQI